MLNYNPFNYTEFLDYVDNTKWLGFRNSSETWSESFSLTKNLQEAKTLARHGWDSWIKMLKDLDTIHVNWTVETEHSIVGASVDIWRYINGQPDCMIEFVDSIERDKPQLTMYIPLWYNCNVDAKNAQEYLKEAMKLVFDKIITHDVEVIWYFLVDQRDNNLEFTTVTLKRFGQQIVLNNFAFAFHPSFFRRIWFRYIETKKYLRSWYWSGNTEIYKTLNELNKLNNKEVWLFPQVTNHDGCKEWDIEKIV